MVGIALWPYWTARVAFIFDTAPLICDVFSPLLATRIWSRTPVRGGAIILMMFMNVGGKMRGLLARGRWAA